jgi:Ca2+-binding EF-hand superfamily protein
MRSFKMLAFGAAAALIAGAGIAIAQTAPPAQGPGAGMQERHHARSQRFVEFLDVDKDGKVSLKEITDEKNRLFGAADVNSDGALSAEEFQRRGHMFMQLRATTLFDLLDVNGDAKLSKEEFDGPAARWFKRYDKNSDGFIAADELPQRAQRGGPGMMGPRR